MSGLYDIIVADPPWKFSSNSKARPGRNAMRHYECMDDAELMALDIPAAPSTLLFLWTTVPMLDRSLGIAKAWGFKYKSQLVWPKSRIGTGFWVRNQHELVLLYTRGKFSCPRPAPFPSSIIEGETREHSRKPESLQDRIDQVWPNARKLEMFARRKRVGWDCYGNETDKFQEVAA